MCNRVDCEYKQELEKFEKIKKERQEYYKKYYKKNKANYLRNANNIRALRNIGGYKSRSRYIYVADNGNKHKEFNCVEELSEFMGYQVDTIKQHLYNGKPLEGFIFSRKEKEKKLNY